MNSKRCIMHIPFNINTKSPSGSQIRPLKMIRAFENIGFNVDLIMGYGLQRKKKIQEIQSNIRNGVRYEFLYAESSTEPTLLTEKNHLPRYPFMDFSFFKFCKKNDIKIGLFYRDIYWKFPIYNESVKTPKRQIAKIFYKYDLYKYNQLLDILYLPTKLMYKYIPFNFKGIIEQLPPGIDSSNLNISKNSLTKSENELLKIFYVGGIGSIYNIKILFESVNEIESVELVVCCRRDEWELEKDNYNLFMNSRIKIIHKSGEELQPYLKECDICSLFFEPVEYRDFAMPVKLFEYMTYCKPIISTKGTAAGDFVESNDIGWNVDYSKEALKDILKSIIVNKKVILDKTTNIDKILKFNTWEARALKVKNDFS